VGGREGRRRRDGAPPPESEELFLLHSVELPALTDAGAPSGEGT